MDSSGKVKDPVCGMTVDPTMSVTSAEYKGTTYHFCSEDCYHTFMGDPKSFV